MRYIGWPSALCFTLPVGRGPILPLLCQSSRFVAAPADSHAKALRHLLRYLKGTVTLGLVYSARAGGAFFGALNQLVAYVDSDWAGDPETRRSTTGFVILLNGTAISWKS